MTTNLTTEHDSAFLAPEVGGLIDQTVQARSVAARISTAFATIRPSVDFPLFTVPVSTGWTGEGAALPVSNSDTASVNVPAFKVTGATEVSAEMLSGDMDPDIAAAIGGSISNNIIRSIDSAVVAASTTADGPSGLLSLSYTSQDTGGPTFSLDDLVKAVYTLQATTDSQLSDLVFLMPPASAEQISLTKQQTGSNQYLTSFTQDGSLLVAGANVPVIVSSLVDPIVTETTGTAAWLVDKTALRLVRREGARVVRTYQPANDTYFISGLARYGFGSVRDAAIVRVHDAA